MSIKRHLTDHQVILILQELVSVKWLQGTVNAEGLLALISVDENARHPNVLLSHQTVEACELTFKSHIGDDPLLILPSLYEAIVLDILH